MDYSLHAATIMHTNVLTDIRVARAAGYQGIELWMPKVSRYLDAGGSSIFAADELLPELGSMRVTMLDALLPIDSTDLATQRRVRSDCVRMAEVAVRLGCPAIQAVPLSRFAESDRPSQRRHILKALQELTDITVAYGLRLALEPVIFSTFNRLDETLDVIAEVGTDRVGLCLDTWHLWLTGTSWDDVAQLDPSLIVAAQLSDTMPKAGPEWRDADRAALPGEGILPLTDAIRAILATEYAGPWTIEMLSPRHWEWEPNDLAHQLLQRARSCMDRARVPLSPAPPAAGPSAARS